MRAKIFIDKNTEQIIYCLPPRHKLNISSTIIIRIFDRGNNGLIISLPNQLPVCEGLLPFGNPLYASDTKTLITTIRKEHNKALKRVDRYYKNLRRDKNPSK